MARTPDMRHPDAHHDARDAQQQQDLEPRVDKLEVDVHQLQADFKSLGNRVYALETGTTVPYTPVPPLTPSDGNLEVRVRKLEEDVHQLQTNYKDLGNRVYKLETGQSVQPPQVTPAPPPTGTLDQRVAKLESDVAQLRLNADNLDERVTALEQEQPPDVEQPPTDTLPPGQEGTENISEGKNLQQLVQAGGTVKLPPGSYLGHCHVTSDVEVIGAPTSLSAKNITIPNRKAMFEGSARVVLRKLNISDVSVPDQNGASCKPNPNMSLLMEDCDITRCQMGVLTGGGTAKIEIYRCHFHDNGDGDGYSHEIYIGNNNEFIITDTLSECGDRSCHALKSRAKKTTIRKCVLKGPTNPSGNVAGSVLDLPEGGEALVEDTEIVAIQGTPTETIIGYAVENANAGIKTLTLRNVKITDGRGNGGVIITTRGGNLVLENCTYTTNNPPRLQGWANVTGQFTKA